MRKQKWLSILFIGMMVMTGCEKPVQTGEIVELNASALTAPQRTAVIRGNLEVATYLDAQVGPRIEQLSFAMNGSFGDYLVQLGDTVEEGQILAEPMLKQFDEQIEACEKQIANLTRQYDYQRLQLEADVTIAQTQIARVSAEIGKLEADDPGRKWLQQELASYDEQRQRLELQHRQLADTYAYELPHYQAQLEELKEKREGNYIRAPFAGTIVALEPMTAGQSVSPKRYYIAIADTTVDYARCPYVSMLTLKNLQEARFWKDGVLYEAEHIPLSHEYYMGTVSVGLDAYSQFQILGAGDAVTDGDIGKVKLIMERKENVLMIPVNALQSSNGSDYVYKNVNGAHELTNVKVGSKSDLWVEIEEGLQEGDMVYVQE